ncbi:MAG: ATP-dependent RecD-like DNA helicase [Firmicutes bacterium ADurb.Bin456]|nr:MAG: ATP-dependent RecD-like DNA helicase [Firmicutes bacterium ADurb.Bin456]
MVEKYETVVPATINGIEKYLGSGLIKGIGPVMARRIVKVFGFSTLDVIETAPDELTKVDGIGPKRIGMIKRAWEEQKEIKEIMIFLQGHGVSASYSAKIFKKYGNASIDQVRENPYRLAADISGIGLITADRIARNMGIDSNSILRVKEGIIYVLNELINEGHVYYPLEPLLAKAAEMLKVDAEITTGAMAELQEEKRIIIEDLPGQPPVKAVYLPAFYTAETNLARLLLNLNREPSPIRPINTDMALEWVAGKIGSNLAEKQKEAVVLSTQNKILIITGGPGTGKTTIIKAIIRIFRAMKLRILLAAPTGRAAKRMQEATGHEAKTIHRLLEYSPRKGGFEKNQESPLEADVIILDESSMIDLMLMYHLVKAVPLNATLILVGDINQLPSVGPGSVLKDLIESRGFKVITLTEIFRQARESRIVTNAHLINKGLFPVLKNPSGRELSDFYFIGENEPEEIINKILQLCYSRIPGRFGFHPVKDIQVLTPMHRGVLGAMNLNLRLQEHLNQNESRPLRGNKSFKVKDKVMQLTNNYDKSVYNGDAGTVTRIDMEEQEIQVDFEGRTVTYDFSELDELALAYAISVHKSQGSEYPAVIIPVVTQHYMLLQRNLIYTGITRGKKLVILIGSKKALAIAIKNNKTRDRYTRLKDRLAEGV